MNWFRIVFDRKTHDAKFRIHRGTGQEINLQIQAELNKQLKRNNDLQNEIDHVKRQLGDFVKTNNALRIQNEYLLQNAHASDQMQGSDPNTMEYAKDALSGYAINADPEVALIRLEVAYDAYDNYSSIIDSKRIATVLNPRESKKEIATRMDTLLSAIGATGSAKFNRDLANK